MPESAVELLAALPDVRDDFVPREHYTSPAFAKLERENLWPKTWQMACRAEDVPTNGSYVLYDILDQSIVVLRTEAGIHAFHNVCPHRGNQLLGQPSGNLMKFACSFHGWQWDLDGNCTFIKDEKEWQGCAAFSRAAMGLKKIHVGEWGGFVFVSMADDPVPFDEFIAPVDDILGCLEFETMTTKWHKTFPLKANWKTAMESFMESYHVYTTHFQLLPVFDEMSYSRSYGQHGMHGYPHTNRPLGAPSPRTGKPIPDDLRAGYVRAIEELAVQTGGEMRVGTGSGRSADAVKRLLDELPASAGPAEIFRASLAAMREAAETEGAGWPEMTPEQMSRLGADWNIFPNMVLVFAFDSTLVFRARPNGDDPDSCIFDMAGLLRCGPSNNQRGVDEIYESWFENRNKIPSLLVQDLFNIEKIQRGMHSIAFDGARTNPVQERQISHHHRVLRSYLNGRDGRDTALEADDATERALVAAE